MQILKRAKGDSDGEIIAFNEDPKNIKEELDRRTHKAGLTARYGECPRATKIMAHGFGESKLNIWPRDENGNLID